MTRRYRRIPLSHDRLRHYEAMRYWVTQKRFGNYTDYDIDVVAHCDDVHIPLMLIHHPRRFCAVDMSWKPAGVQLTLPAQEQVRIWCKHALALSPAPKDQKRFQVDPNGAIVHGIELDAAKALCQQVWEYLLEPWSDRNGGDAA